METKVVRIFILAKTLERASMSWSFSTYVLFLQSIGLSLLEANLINTFFMSISTILDPFTGNWGDRIGQKKIYLIGLMFWSLAHFIYGTANIFVVCAIAESIAAIGRAFISEALESWLRNHVDEETTHKALTSAQLWSQFATIIPALLGGYIGSIWGLRWPWFIGVGNNLIVLIIVWWKLRKISETKTEIISKTELNLWEITKNVWRDTILRRSFIAVSGLSACFMPFNMFWTIIFKEASGSISWLGSMWIGISLASALGSFLAKKMKINSKNLAIIVLSISLPMLIPIISGNWLITILFPFLIHEIGRSIWTPILFSYTNRRISNNIRTSVNSLRSSAGTFGAVIGLIVSGILTTWFTPTQVWAISAVALIIIAIWIWTWNHDQ